MALTTISATGRRLLRRCQFPDPADKRNVMTNSSNILAEAPESENRRKAHRLLCSDLITVHWGSGRGYGVQEAAVLEDYSPTGASLYIAVPIEPGVAVTIHTTGESFGAQVLRCEWRDNGYLVGIEFDKPRLEESPFLPDHLVDPQDLGL
jgi:hypothetical protein